MKKNRVFPLYWKHTMQAKGFCCILCCLIIVISNQWAQSIYWVCVTTIATVILYFAMLHISWHFSVRYGVVDSNSFDSKPLTVYSSVFTTLKGWSISKKCCFQHFQHWWRIRDKKQVVCKPHRTSQHNFLTCLFLINTNNQLPPSKRP